VQLNGQRITWNCTAVNHKNRTSISNCK